MSDQADLAFNEQESVIENALAYRKKEVRLKPIGECYYCGKPFTSNIDRLFCNSTCEKNYMKEQELIKQNRF